jgi:hypothetical protein
MAFFFGIVILHQQDVPADLPEVRLVHSRGAHPESGLVQACREVPIAQAPDPVEELEVPLVPRVQVFLHGEGRRQKVQLVELLSGPGDGVGDGIPVPKLLREVGVVDVVQHQAAGGQGTDALVHCPEVLVGAVPTRHHVVPLLRSDEVGMGKVCALFHQSDEEVAEGPHEEGIPLLHGAPEGRIDFRDAHDEHGLCLPSERPGIRWVHEVDDQGSLVRVGHERVAVVVEHLSEPCAEPGDALFFVLPHNRVIHAHSSPWCPDPRRSGDESIRFLHGQGVQRPIRGASPLPSLSTRSL